MKLGFIGAGNMATALIKAMKDGNEIISSDKDEEKLQKAAQQLKIKVTGSNKAAAGSSEIIFLCAKPNDITGILEEVKSAIKSQVIVSIAAGIKISSIENIIGSEKKIIRVMPNLNCIANEMAAAYCCNKSVKNAEKQIIGALLNKAGIAIELGEDKMDIVTALSGSGPAFVACIAGYFSKAAEKEGLSKEASYKLALQTFFGTSKMLRETKQNPEEFIAKVASPKGATIAGLEVLESSSIKKIIEKAISAAAKRSRELGKDE